MKDVPTIPINVDEYHVPEPLKTYDIWVVWSPDVGKQPLAPWQEEHMYPAQWAADKADPRTPFGQANAVASKPVGEITDKWPFPPDVDVRTVKPGVLLPPRDYDLMFVDLDDVILDGEMTAEARGILERLGGYAEASKSYLDPGKDEAGAHAWVKADLPDGRSKIIADLHDAGQLELYTNQARMTGGTWQHIENTPKDTVPDAQDTIDELVEEYAKLDEDNDNRPPPTGDTDEAAQVDRRRSRNDNPYYHLRVTDVADTGPFSAHSRNWQGPHPAHGGTSTKDRKSINFNVDPSEEVWHCFAHEDGGGALSLIATLEGIVNCGETWKVHNDPKALFETCLAARDKYANGQLEGETPPYKALVGAAKEHDLPMSDEDKGILGRAYYAYASDLFDGLEYGNHNS